MLDRFLFVAGMTVGVMVPLVWAAYMSRPTPPNAGAPAIGITGAAPEMKKAAPVATKDVTASIPVTPVLPKTMETIRPKQSTPLTAITPERAIPMQSHSQLARMVRPQHAPHRYLPAVVHSYNGAHIMTICAALTVTEQLRAGCP